MLGVLPWREDLWLDAEDSLDLDSRPRAALPLSGLIAGGVPTGLPTLVSHLTSV